MSDRKKPKKYHKMGYQQKHSYVKDELAKLGGEGVYYDDGGARGSASTGMFDLEASEDQLRALASNDYDRRESIKYGVDSGDKRFKDVGNGGFGSMDELVNADRAIAKYGYNELGHTNMSSHNDYAAVSNSLFKASRDKFQGDIENEITNDINGIRDEIELTRDWKSQAATDPQRFEHSDPVAQAQANLDKYKLNLGGKNIFSKENAFAARADDSKDAARSFAGSYINDLKVAGNIGESADNLINAANTIASYRR
jgi:hypothetical protein